MTHVETLILELTTGERGNEKKAPSGLIISASISNDHFAAVGCLGQISSKFPYQLFPVCIMNRLNSLLSRSFTDPDHHHKENYGRNPSVSITSSNSWGLFCLADMIAVKDNIEPLKKSYC